MLCVGQYKINLGNRPAEGTSDAQIGAIAEALNELGRRTAELGIRLAPHPHIWGPIERPEEVIRLLELTDPEYVSLVIDTAQINLVGGDRNPVFAYHLYRVVGIPWE